MTPSSPAPRSRSSRVHLRTRSSCQSTRAYYSSPAAKSHGLWADSTSSETAATERSALSEHGATIRRPRRTSRQDEADKRPTTFQMVRQDSGYESGPPAPRTSSSRKRNSSQPRPSVRRAGTASQVPRSPRRSSLTVNRPSFLTPQQQKNINRKNSYFQFPAPENLERHDDADQPVRLSIDLAPVILKVNTANLHPEALDAAADPLRPTTRARGAWPAACAAAAFSLRDDDDNDDDEDDDGGRGRHRGDAGMPAAVPPTTHYWTSDRTRQLEYAAIDAASQGVRGWVMRNVVPDCLVPSNHRRAGFDDDGGSVRRYRLELEVECPGESVPPSPVGEKLSGFRARATAKRTWWSWKLLKGCNA